MAEPVVSHRYLDAIRSTETIGRWGYISQVTPMHIESNGPNVPLGSLCCIDSETPIFAEVVRASQRKIVLMPYGSTATLTVGDRVELHSTGNIAAVGAGLIGRAVDALGRPVDGCGPIALTERRPLDGVPIGALQRAPITEPLQTGIRAIDGLLTLGIGQRVGIFAGSGVGKTTLLSALTSNVESDYCVLCLVGERGREAHDLWQGALNDKTRSRSTMVVATSDQPAILRARAVLYALSIAEHLRESGKNVLLLVDSLTRYAMALREIGLASGEPPTIRAYTPSVFALLPRVIERCGALSGAGAITALMTVLTEGDDTDDPLAETLKSILDGHIVLSRELAEQQHFPAIDVPRSISRVLSRVTTARQRHLIGNAISQLSLYQSSKTLIEAGLYTKGATPALDRALSLRPDLLAFLRQEAQVVSSNSETWASLQQLVEKDTQ